jgi:hypothetical protein
MTIVPGTIVPAPAQIRHRYGLLDAASGPLDLPAHGEGGGVRFVPQTCGESYAYGVACYGPGEAPIKPLDGDAAEVHTGVFAVISTLNCGAPGYTVGEYRAKVRNILEGTEQASVEHALWSGLDSSSTALDILNLNTEAVAVPAGYDPGSIADVVGTLERYAYATHQYGGVAYIHAPVEVAALAAEEGLVHQDGPRKVTPLGSVWVFGDYPAGEIIITGQVTIWRAPDISVYDSFDTTTNERLLVAERAYAVAFECFAGRASYSPPDIPPAGSVPGETVPVAMTGSDQVITATAGVFYQGFTLAETSGTAGALVRIYDNAAAPAGTLLDIVSLCISESAREYYYPGIPVQHGIYLDVVSGAVSGSVRTA